MINPKDYPAFDFSLKEWHTEQMFCSGDEAWLVQNIWDAAKDLPVYEVPLIGFCTAIQPWDRVGEDMRDFCKHMLLVNKADLKYPIILTPGGDIADGRHRLVKAIVSGRSTIKVQRLTEMPDPDFEFNEDGELVEQ